MILSPFLALALYILVSLGSIILSEGREVNVRTSHNAAHHLHVSGVPKHLGHGTQSLDRRIFIARQHCDPMQEELILATLRQVWLWSSNARAVVANGQEMERLNRAFSDGDNLPYHRRLLIISRYDRVINELSSGPSGEINISCRWHLSRPCRLRTSRLMIDTRDFEDGMIIVSSFI